MELKEILAQFLGSEAEKYSLEPITNGLINHTYIVENPDEKEKYILQKLNTKVFTKPENIAHNHLTVNRALDNSGYNKTILRPLKTTNGNYFDEHENSWRMLEFIENSKTFLKVPNSDCAYKAAAAFSEFYEKLNTYELEILDPLPGFIDFEKRIRDYETALQNAKEDLKEKAAQEINFINENISLPNRWINAAKENQLQKHIIHADPKISNVLFSNDDEPLAIIDLDTVMYGTLLYDFGDMVRSYTNKSEEDDGETENNFSPEIFIQVKKGFLSHLDNVLTPEEIDMMDYAAQTVIYIQAVRFLTDYLNGSQYYSINYPEHNLDRTKNQINLLKGLMDYTNKN